MNLKLKIVFIILGLIAVYAAGLGMRRAVLNSQYEMLGPDFPFTLESALQFRNVETLADGDSLPEVDKKIQYPDGVVTMENDTIGAEYVYAFVSSLLPESIPLKRVSASPGWCRKNRFPLKHGAQHFSAFHR